MGMHRASIGHVFVGIVRALGSYIGHVWVAAWPVLGDTGQKSADATLPHRSVGSEHQVGEVIEERQLDHGTGHDSPKAPSVWCPVERTRTGKARLYPYHLSPPLNCLHLLSRMRRLKEKGETRGDQRVLHLF